MISKALVFSPYLLGLRGFGFGRTKISLRVSAGFDDEDGRELDDPGSYFKVGLLAVLTP